MAPLAAWVDGIGVLGPGMAGLAGGSARADGRGALAARRRRCCPCRSACRAPSGGAPARRCRLTLAVGLEATAQSRRRPGARSPTVFTSSGGDGQNCHEICQALASAERQLSPTRFHNSVHNAAAGYWGIATGATAASNALCAYDASFAAGLLEALIQVAVERTAVLLIAYDASYPEPLRSVRPIPDAFGVALVLAPVARRGLARAVTACLERCSGRSHGGCGAREAARLDAGGAQPAVAGAARARRAPGRVAIEYLDGRPHRAGGEPVPLDRQWIEQHIPHKGRMCLLDEVLSWDAARIRCRSATHRASDNPLRSHGRLGAACGIEYAAQAMAVHGALVAASAPLERTVASSVRGSIGAAVGYLASVRNVALHVARLDDLRGGSHRRRAAHHRRRAHGAVRVLRVERRAAAAERPRQHRVRRRVRPARRRQRSARVSGSGRRALVTGGSGGIGGALCRRLAREGHHVYVHSHRGAAVAEALVREIVAGGGHATAINFDITDTRCHAALRSRRCSRPGRSRSSSTTPASTTMRCCPA